MKSDHRHELKTNELAEWIAHLPQWFQENGRTLLIWAAVVIVVVAGYAWRRYSTNVLQVKRRVGLTSIVTQVTRARMQVLENGTQGQDDSALLTASAEALANSAQGESDKGMAALALLKQGEVIRCQVHYRHGQLNAEDVAKQIDQARAAYTQALDKAGSDASLKAAALYGLGLCAEEVGQITEAQGLYKGLIADASLAGTTSQAAAEYRLQNLDRFQVPIVFHEAPSTPVPVAPVAGPEDQTVTVMPADANAPNTMDANSAAK